MIYLLEIEPYDPALGATVTHRFATAAFVTEPSDIPANIKFPQRLADPGNYARHLFGEGRTRGDSDVAVGEIRIVNNDGALDGLLDLAFDGRALRLYSLASAQAAWAGRATVLIGTMEQAEFSGTHVTIRLRDRLALLDEAIQTAAYLGTTTNGGLTVAEGNTDLKDVKKPRLFGRCFTIPPVTVDDFDHLYQVSSGPIAAVDAVRDNSVALTKDADYPTLAALKAATLVGGRFATCLALGLIRTASRPSGTLTIDATEGATLTDRSAARIAQRMVATVPGMAIDASDVAALHVANPAECGLWTGTSEITVLSAVAQVLASVGAWVSVDRLGAVRTERLELPSGSAATVLHEGRIIDTGGGLSRFATSDDGDGVPARSVTVRWGRSYTVMSEQDLKGPDTTAAFRSFAVQEWRLAKTTSAMNEAIHPKGPELVFDTCLTSQGDAEAEAARLLSIYSARRDLFRLSVPAEKASGIDLGDVVTLQSRRFGLSDGRPVRVIGMTETFAAAKTELEVWG